VILEEEGKRASKLEANGEKVGLMNGWNS